MSYGDASDDSEEVKNIFNKMVSSLELDCHGYAISDIRELLNQRLLEEGIGWWFSEQYKRG